MVVLLLLQWIARDFQTPRKEMLDRLFDPKDEAVEVIQLSEEVRRSLLTYVNSVVVDESNG